MANIYRRKMHPIIRFGIVLLSIFESFKLIELLLNRFGNIEIDEINDSNFLTILVLGTFIFTILSYNFNSTLIYFIKCEYKDLQRRRLEEELKLYAEDDENYEDDDEEDDDIHEFESLFNEEIHQLIVEEIEEFGITERPNNSIIIRFK